MSLIEFSSVAKGYTKSPLGIIALFIVLVYGLAALVVGYGNNSNIEITPLIYFMSIFPVIVFFGFMWLVTKHHRKLYGPSDFKDEENFLKTQISSAALLAAAETKYSGDGKELNGNKIDEIVDLLISNVYQNKSREKWKNKILWVDDVPENNIYERQAFEAQGLEIRLALSTDEALTIMDQEKFAVVISDMGRAEGTQEGYVLLDKLRASNDNTPFIIYAGSNLPKHKRMARERGAQGSTNRANELFQLVMGFVNNGK
ncbi:response regulator [Maridesulfovibrio sp.]|uniref:response regulator n=1 Tax=Maridesulfovibrio sp. TaxID=2795000 RepID=UPI002A18BD90|nr:response regulator [Maridesulfovibrio sp.]